MVKGMSSDDGTHPPTDEDLEAEILAMQSVLDARAAARRRQEAERTARIEEAERVEAERVRVAGRRERKALRAKVREKRKYIVVTEFYIETIIRAHSLESRDPRIAL